MAKQLKSKLFDPEYQAKLKAEKEKADNAKKMNAMSSGDIRTLVDLEEQETGKLFDESIKNKFPLLVPGGFQTRYPDIDFTISPDNDQVQIITFYKNQKGMEKHTTVKILEDGQMLPEQKGGLPKELIDQIIDKTPGYKTCLQQIKDKPRNLDSLKNRLILNAILKETIRIEQKMRPTDKMMLMGAVDIVLQPGPPQERGPISEQPKKRERAKIDLERLDFMFSQENLICAIAPGTETRIRYGTGGRYGTGKPTLGGFNDYHAFIFPKGAITENAVRENAMYEWKFPEPIPQKAIDAWNKGDQEPVRQHLDEIGFFKDLSTGNKQESNMGQYYKKHPSKKNEKGTEKFRKEVTKHIQEELV